MKKKMIFLIGMCLVLSGCGAKQTTDWQDESTFGDINLEAETVDIYTVDEEFEIDNYLKIDEINQTNPDNITTETFRLYYNRIGEQAGLPYILPTNGELEQEDSIFTDYSYTEDGTGVYIKSINETEKLRSVYCEFRFASKSNEVFYESVSRIFAAFYGGVPNVTKYDLNKVFFELADVMKEEKATYETSYNDIIFSVQRDYGYVYVTVLYPYDFQE